MIKATIKTLGEYQGAGVYRLWIESNDHQDFGCDDFKDPVEITKYIGEARRKFHNQLDTAIDIAAMDFIKGKIKNID